MMGVKAVYSLLCDCWDMYRRYCPEKLDDEKWGRFIDEVSVVSKKYNNEPLAQKTLLALFDEIETSQNRVEVQHEIQDR